MGFSRQPARKETERSTTPKIEVRAGGMVFFSAQSRRTLRLCGETPRKEKSPRRRRDRRGRAEFLFRQTALGALICETETLKRLFLQPFSAINYVRAARQHNLAVFAPFDGKHATRSVHIHAPARLVVNDRGDDGRAGTST